MIKKIQIDRTDTGDFYSSGYKRPWFYVEGNCELNAYFDEYNILHLKLKSQLILTKASIEKRTATITGYLGIYDGLYSMNNGSTRTPLATYVYDSDGNEAQVFDFSAEITYNNASNEDITFEYMPKIEIGAANQYGSYMAINVSDTGHYVVYNALGGEPEPKKQSYLGSDGGTTLSMVIPRKEMMVFKGWATSKNAETAQYQPGGYFSSKVEGKNTLYAVWKEGGLLTFDANGGENAPDSINGGVITLPEGTPARADRTVTATVTFDTKEEGAVIAGPASQTYTKHTVYTFKCWNTRADGLGDNYNPGDDYEMYKDQTLYAVWTERADAEINIPQATLDGYVLLGWTEDETDITYVKPPYRPDTDKTLYAVWGLNNGSAIKFPYAVPVNLEEGDTIRIVGLKDANNDGVYTVDSTVYADGIQTIILKEPFLTVGKQNALKTPVTIFGSGMYVPDMDYICSLNNRLWGCSSHYRTIYSSALGDPGDFWTFEGTTLDAFQVAVGSADEFTGCVALNNNVVFFKQHTIHKILGNYPAEYALYTYQAEGVSKSNGRSLTACDGEALYVGEHGLSRYAGSASSMLSSELGESKKTDALGLYDGMQYALYFKDENGEDKSYVMDFRHGIWTELGYGKVLDFAHLGEDNYVLRTDPDGINRIYRYGGATFSGDWEILYREFYEDYSSEGGSSHIFEKKRYTGITIRLELPEESWIEAEIRADGGEWKTCMRQEGSAQKVVDYHIYTPRCDKLQLKLKGHGPMTIIGLERQYTTGSRR